LKNLWPFFPSSPLLPGIGAFFSALGASNPDHVSFRSFFFLLWIAVPNHWEAGLFFSSLPLPGGTVHPVNDSCRVPSRTPGKTKDTNWQNPFSFPFPAGWGDFLQEKLDRGWAGVPFPLRHRHRANRLPDWRAAAGTFSSPFVSSGPTPTYVLSPFPSGRISGCL